MRFNIFLFAAILLIGFSGNTFAQKIQHPVKGKQYEAMRFHISENLGFENPFDLVNNEIELHITQPDYTTCVLSFFYDGVKDGVEQWEARFTPKQAGSFLFVVKIQGKIRDQFSIQVEKNNGKKQGGLRLSNQLGAFCYESGEAFRGIGLNVCWAEDYEYYFKKMHDAGINITRIWMCPWHLSFEWQETGLGKYNLETARRLDTILTLAEKYNIFVDLCLDYHGIAPKGIGFFKEDRWLVNPYNALNGGPCTDAMDFFTNDEAKRFSKRKYKYIISRFGYSNALATWEFLNEADLMAGQSIPVNQWHIEMAEYVQSNDVHDRLVTSSSTRRYVEKLVDAFRSPAFDYIHFHDYNMLDIAPHLTYLLEAATEYYRKPVIMGEFGVEYRGGDLTYKVDSQHVGLHNGIWVGLFNETPVIPMSWWWDSYIDQYNLWFEYKNLTRFAERIDFDVKNLKFQTLRTGYINNDPQQQVQCFVRSIHFGPNCALWFKNEEYKWWMVSEGKEPATIPSFVQPVLGLNSGKYSVQWYDPQKGEFYAKEDTLVVSAEGVALVAVPSFKNDIACLIFRIR